VFFEEPSFYWNHPSKIIAVWEGGFTFYGAMLSSVAAIFFYCRLTQLAFLNILDLVATSTLLSIAIGRIGCFLAGCCWGTTCSLPWAVTFGTENVHPAQLYESLGAFFLFILCQKYLFTRAFFGSIGLKALLGYSLLRFFVEFFRGDTYRGFIFNGLMSYSQMISVIIALIATSFLLILRRKNS
jgi:phosphatidylglycerol:prolipoprotein diacylglycerol transferase